MQLNPSHAGIWTSAIKQEVWRTFGDAKKSIADEKASIVNLLPAKDYSRTILLIIIDDRD